MGVGQAGLYHRRLQSRVGMYQVEKLGNGQVAWHWAEP